MFFYFHFVFFSKIHFSFLVPKNINCADINYRSCIFARINVCSIFVKTITVKNASRSNLKNRLYVIIFKSNTPAGKLFDVALLVVIIVNLLAVMFESIDYYRSNYGYWLRAIEWMITALFTIEYALRIWVLNKKSKYIFSFYGIVDLLAILPSFIGLFIAGTHLLVVIRTLRLLRIFSVFQLSNYTKQGNFILRSIASSWSKISVFLLSVIAVITVIGTLMYLIEGAENGFKNIPISIYWTIVTITTVGYGDISPATPAGQFLASIAMIIGYSIIAVPTGIITAEAMKSKKQSITCPRCFSDKNTEENNYCSTCGFLLKKE
ncbi:MAG: ion transporter [Bacteroidales bacterium]|nr:ion transporter [Bacteroidales bacterium]